MSSEVCGWKCPYCGHCCSWIVEWNPVEGVMFEIECKKCSMVQWVPKQGEGRAD